MIFSFNNCRKNIVAIRIVFATEACTTKSQLTTFFLNLINGMKEVFQHTYGHPARSFPAALPLFRLDRIYVRGFSVKQARVHHGPVWARISDHAALSSTIVKTP